MDIAAEVVLARNLDNAMYIAGPDDHKVFVPISLADLKEILLAIRANSQRIGYLLEDLERAEARIEKLESVISTFA